jgi:uncharacterized membrane protein YsdA (DUF1294 family)
MTLADVPMAAWLYLLTISLITFCFYGIDKYRSMHHHRRIPESTLHVLALIGGTLGALIGQQVFRHKTKKLTFRLVFILIAISQACFIFWWVLHKSGTP